MKLAISTSGNKLDSPFDIRFGRAAAFCIVNVETGEWQAFDNPALSASGGAGVKAAQFVASQGAGAVVSGAYGPNAFDTLAAAQIEMYLAPGNQVYTAAEILDMFKAGELVRAEAATHAGHHGGHR
ncbi:MAG: NifB/NifX family molybdenum-iron cluster-binding protein [Anaerolineales bacterium]|jgi:predicted Fe-Mo cluster-binding NifX family protein